MHEVSGLGQQVKARGMVREIGVDMNSESTLASSTPSPPHHREDPRCPTPRFGARPSVVARDPGSQAFPKESHSSRGLKGRCPFLLGVGLSLCGRPPSKPIQPSSCQNCRPSDMPSTRLHEPRLRRDWCLAWALDSRQKFTTKPNRTCFPHGQNKLGWQPSSLQH